MSLYFKSQEYITYRSNMKSILDTFIIYPNVKEQIIKILPKLSGKEIKLDALSYGLAFITSAWEREREREREGGIYFAPKVIIPRRW